MKNLLYGIALCLLVQVTFAQDASIFQKNKNVYVKSLSNNENAIKTVEELINQLNEWSYWNVVTDPKEADFVLKAEVSASKGITATSWGGTSYELVAKLAGKNDQVLWESNHYKASPNGMNGFNAGKSVVKKLMRDLKKKFGRDRQ